MTDNVKDRTTSKIYPGVEVGEGTIIGDFCVIGVPPRGKKPGQLRTVIGRDCHIRSHSVIYAGTVMGDRFQMGHGGLVREDNRIGSDVSVGSHSVVEHHVDIRDRVRIHSQAFIPEFTVLEEGVWLGPGVVVTNAPYPASARTKEFLKGVVVRENAKVGANVTLLPGVTVGRNSLVGAGSVVSKDIGEGVVVAGNPAREISAVSELRHPDGSKAYED